ncbi:MAG: GtrA family protein [Acidimicrobiales bacterium]
MGRYAVVGVSNSVVDFAVFNVILLISPTRSPGRLVMYNTVAVLCAIANSYRWNRRWTFRVQHALQGWRLHRERLLYGLQAVLNIVVNNAVLLAVTIIFNRNHVLPAYAANNLAKLLGVLMASTASFVAMRWVVFRPPPEGSMAG